MAMGFGLDHFPFRLSLLVVVCVSIMGGFVMADPAKDREECTQQLAGLATCLPYVDGEAKAPTPDCCSGLKQVLKDNKKCLCVIVRDRNDPDLGLQINATLALGLPSVCNAPANVSKCPELLHMDPKSPEAQVFYQLEKNSTGNADAPAQSPTAGGPVSTKSQGMSSGSRTQGYFSGNKGLGSDILIRGVMLWYFMGQHLLI
ncbi:non-specific lipid transfer protein GPI-anchored 14 [Ziziphus jujuba]|uniref:Non-specific lipid transfer protein GPI-anchored 14 n=1 Tax=Ziziphus jujuba TaxID=326968 RepID=A0A6P4ARM4_ZIZJJ|nr:non-specific lipid transfer protein GPI-anchored 14 [Ziziphus jujuba]